MMAPDINSLPTSPRPDRQPSHPTSGPASNNPSRRTSAIMPPPTHPASSNPRSPTISSSEVPMRHPRPLTAAELYAECEKEQEAVVNRLTRELTALRAQSASVASNTSVSSNSTSASLLPVDISDPNPTHQLTGATHPTPSRRHRSSSSVSSRSIATPSTSAASVAGSVMTNHPHQVPSSTMAGAVTAHHGVSQASADRAAAVTRNPRESLSRQPSLNTSGTSTPARRSMDMSRNMGTLYTLPHRPSISRDTSSNTISSTLVQPPTPHIAPSLSSPGQSPMQQNIDTTAHRTELEIVKAENEALRQRVRNLEQALRTRRRDSSQSDAQRPDLTSGRRTRENSESVRIPSISSPPSASLGVAAWADGGVGGVAGPRERSESQSTTASSRRAMGVPEDDVRVGESASSVGVGRGV